MPYRYLEEVAKSDVAFEAWGKTLEEAFISAADATANVMVDELGSIRKTEQVSFELYNDDLDMLLFNFLNELIYLKDVKKLLLRVEGAEIKKDGPGYRVKAAASGEAIDYTRHPLKVDVKAVTLHLFGLKKTGQGWMTTVVLDI